jgi:hypothetical protein
MRRAAVGCVLTASCVYACAPGLVTTGSVTNEQRVKLFLEPAKAKNTLVGSVTPITLK